MRKVLLLILPISLFIACQTEDINVMEESSDEIILKRNSQILSGPSIVNSSVNSLNTCSGSFLNSVDDITVTSAWTVGDSTTDDYIDFVLEDAFSCSFYFSSCYFRLAKPTSIETVEFIVADNGYLDFDPFLGDVVTYDYLSDNISPAIAEELKLHFACEIIDYQSTYYGLNQSVVTNVDFNGDALLCTCPSGQSRFVRATVTFYVYE